MLYPVESYDRNTPREDTPLKLTRFHSPTGWVQCDRDIAWPRPSVFAFMGHLLLFSASRLTDHLELRRASGDEAIPEG